MVTSPAMDCGLLSAAQNIQDSETRILDACILSHLPDAVFLIDPVTSNIVYANSTACRSVGIPLREILHSSVLSLQEDVISESQWQEIAEVISCSKKPYLFLGRHKRKDGSTFPVEVYTSNATLCGQHRAGAYFD